MYIINLDSITTLSEYKIALSALGQMNISTRLDERFTTVASITSQIEALYNSKLKFNLVPLLLNCEEWIRTITSVKLAISSKNKAFEYYTGHAANLSKRIENLDKLKNASLIRSDKIAIANAEIQETETLVVQSRKEYLDICMVLEQEFLRVDQDVVRDFIEASRLFVDAFISGQKEVLELWKGY